MAKGKASAALIILGLIILAGVSVFFFVQQSAIPPGWKVYDDFTVPDAGLLGTGTGKWVILNDNTLVGYLSGGGIGLGKKNYFGVQPSIRSSIDMQGYSVEARMTGITVGCNPVIQYACLDSATLVMNVNNIGGSVAGSVGVDRNNNIYPIMDTTIVRITSDPVGNLYESMADGVSGSTSESTGVSYLTFTGQGYITSVIFKLPFNCKVQEGELLVYEPVPSGKTISIASFQHSVARFCYEHPVVVLKEGVGSDTSSTPYERMAAGETVLVPVGQDWGVFYVAKNDGTFPACGTDEVFSEDTDRCRKLTGLAVSCPSGLFDTVTGECVVGNLVLCPDGGRYTINQDGSKSCDYLLPTNYICTDPDAVAFPALGKCILTFATEIECSEKEGTWNPALRACEWFPLSVVKCSDPLAAYSSITNSCEKIIKTSLSDDCARISDGKGIFTPPDTCTITTRVVEEVIKEVVVKEKLVYVKDIEECVSKGGKFSEPDKCVVKLSVTEQITTTPDIAGCIKKGGQAVEKEGRVICRTPVPGEEELFCENGEPNAATGKCVVRGDITVLPVFRTSPWLIGLAALGVVSVFAGLVIGGLKLFKR